MGKKEEAKNTLIQLLKESCSEKIDISMVQFFFDYIYKHNPSDALALMCKALIKHVFPYIENNVKAEDYAKLGNIFMHLMQMMNPFKQKSSQAAIQEAKNIIIILSG
jgi:hypothetical protein